MFLAPQNSRSADINPGINEELKAAETIAFVTCESTPSNGPGLTWDEVDKCMRKFEDYAKENEIFVTTRDAFDKSDLNRDGVLEFDEWMKSMKN